MGSGIRGVLSGALTLVLLQVLVSSGSSRVGGLFGVPAAWAKRFLDPTLPAIPDRRGAAPTQNLRGGVGGGYGAPGPAAAPPAQYPDPFTPRRPAPVSPGGD